MTLDRTEPRWPPLQSRLLREICHDLTGRASAMRGLSEVQALQDPAVARAWAGKELSAKEADRLEELAQDLSIITDRIQTERALLDLHYATLPLVRIMGRLGDRAVVPVEVLPPGGDPPAVRTYPARLSRLLLIAMDGFLAYAREAGFDGALVQVVRAGDDASLVLSTAAPGEGSPGESVVEPPRPELLLEELGVEWRWESGPEGASLTLVFPRAPSS